MKHTTAIANGKLSTSKMAVGDSLVGEIIDLKEGKFGPILVMKSNGQEVTVFPSGNLKIFVKDILDGKRSMEGNHVITRIADVQYKGFPVTQFSFSNGAEETTATPTEVKVEQTMAEKLAALRSKSKRAGA